MKLFCSTLFWGFRKIVQNGQTEQKQGYVLAFGTRRRMCIRRVAKFVHSIKQYLFLKFVLERISTSVLIYLLQLCACIYTIISVFFCFMRSVHFATAPAVKSNFF